MVYSCRICGREEKNASQLVAPCDCDTPLLRWVHPACLRNVVPTSCPICQFSYQQRPSLPFGLSERLPPFMIAGIVALFFQCLVDWVWRGTFWALLKTHVNDIWHTSKPYHLVGHVAEVLMHTSFLLALLIWGRVALVLVAHCTNSNHYVTISQQDERPVHLPLVFVGHQIDTVAMMLSIALWHHGFYCVCDGWRLDFFRGATLYVPVMLASYYYGCVLAWQGRLAVTVLSLGYTDSSYWFPPVNLSSGGRYAALNLYMVIVVLLLHCVLVPLLLNLVGDFWDWLCVRYPPRVASKSSFHFLFVKLVAWTDDRYRAIRW
ncbi:hypothetical protein QOT17_011740 [Balamuthia mandrillaris]